MPSYSNALKIVCPPVADQLSKALVGVCGDSLIHVGYEGAVSYNMATFQLCNNSLVADLSNLISEANKKNDII